MKNKNGLGVVFRKTVRQNSGMTLLTGILIAACVAAGRFSCAAPWLLWAAGTF